MAWEPGEGAPGRPLVVVPVAGRVAELVAEPVAEPETEPGRAPVLGLVPPLGANTPSTRRLWRQWQV